MRGIVRHTVFFFARSPEAPKTIIIVSSLSSIELPSSVSNAIAGLHDAQLFRRCSSTSIYARNFLNERTSNDSMMRYSVHENVEGESRLPISNAVASSSTWREAQSLKSLVLPYPQARKVRLTLQLQAPRGGSWYQPFWRQGAQGHQRGAVAGRFGEPVDWGTLKLSRFARRIICTFYQ